MVRFEDLTHLFSIDWEELERHVQELSRSFPRAGVSNFGGWAVQGANGSFKDGWVDGSAFIKYLPNGGRGFDYAAAKEAGLLPNKEHTQITDASCPAINDYVQQMTELGFAPVRSRLIDLRPGDRSTWHVDSSKDVLTLRMHAVVRTNPHAWFINEQGPRHLLARHVYLINVNRHHQVKNDGQTSRTHLVTDVEDTKKVSKVHGANS